MEKICGENETNSLPFLATEIIKLQDMLIILQK